MCLNPVKIPNPNYGKGHIGTMFTKDTTHHFMEVPCGHCADCVAAAQSQIVQRAEVEDRYNHIFFATLTYDNKHLPELEVYVPEEINPTLAALDDVARDYETSAAEREERESRRVDQLIADFESSSDAYEIPDLTDASPSELLPQDPNPVFGDNVKVVKFKYADIKHIQDMLKRIRDNVDFEGRSMKYLCVSELGKTNGRPHFHLLFFIQKKPSDFLPGGIANPAVTSRLEKKLRDACFKYWAVNIGTRKNPVYEQCFTYARKFYGRKCYTNFDLHYVDPAGRASFSLNASPKLAESGSKNVIFYVTKYLMKGSERDQKRQQFLRLNLDDSQYRYAWNIIKCRMTISKGFGVNATFSTEEVGYSFVPIYPDMDLSQKLKMYNEYVATCADIPVTFHDFCNKRVPVSRRVMHPDKELMASLKKDALRDVGISPGPVFINYEGKHVPLAHYYQRFADIYDSMDLLTCWFNWDPTNDVKRSELPKEEKDDIIKKHKKKLSTMMANSTFDTSPALLFPGDEGNTFNTISL